MPDIRQPLFLPPPGSGMEELMGQMVILMLNLLSSPLAGQSTCKIPQK